MKNFVNLTPHPINIISGENICIPSSGSLRLSQEDVILSKSPRIVEVRYGELSGIPEGITKDTPVIVSAFVAPVLILRGYTQVFTPNTGPTENGAVRFTEEDAPTLNLIGKIKGVRSLIKHS